MVLVVVGVILVVAAIAFGAKRARDEQLGRQRAEANELRQEAGARYEEAKESGAAAEEQAQQAHHDRVAAATAARRADEVDPDVES
jgi:hypothetical protein